MMPLHACSESLLRALAPRSSSAMWWSPSWLQPRRLRAWRRDRQEMACRAMEGICGMR